MNNKKVKIKCLIETDLQELREIFGEEETEDFVFYLSPSDFVQVLEDGMVDFTIDEIEIEG
jgi:hypothetical protein